VIAVDTSVWVDFFHGTRTPVVLRLIDLVPRTGIVVGDLVLCEVLRGVRNERQAAEIGRILSGFHQQPLVGPGIAMKAAENYRLLRSLGITLRGTVDLLIGTYCIENDVPLLHADRDFEPMEKHLGLKAA